MYLPTAAEWAARLGLKRRGSEWAGPCPLCGGCDRLHVRQTDRGCLVGCRHCIDGQAPSVRGGRFGQLLATVFPERILGRRASAAPDISHQSRSGTRPTKPGLDRRPALLWSRGSPVADTSAATYLRDRRVQPPGAPYPESVRWIPREVWPAGLPRDASPKLRVPPLPDGVAGCLLFAWRRLDGAGFPAVSCEGLAADGRRLPQRWRRTVGRKRASLFYARNRVDGLGVLVEGELDALAARWLVPDATRVAAVGGTAGLVALRLPRGGAGWTLLPDGDAKGRNASEQVHAAHPRLTVYWRGLDGGDPANDLAEAIDERLAVRLDGDRPECEADLELAWDDYLQTRRAA